MREASAELRRALELARPGGNPALLLTVASQLLVLDGDDEVAREARAAVEAIIEALPNDEMRARFAAAEAVQVVRR